MDLFVISVVSKILRARYVHFGPQQLTMISGGFLEHSFLCPGQDYCHIDKVVSEEELIGKLFDPLCAGESSHRLKLPRTEVTILT